MKTLKLFKYVLLVCCIAFASQAWSQTRSLTVTGEEGSIEKFMVTIQVYKGTTLLENVTMRMGSDEDDFVRSYTEANYPTRVYVKLESCVPGMAVYFNGMETFYYYYTVCTYSDSFSLTSGNNNIRIKCL